MKIILSSVFFVFSLFIFPCSLLSHKNPTHGIALHGKLKYPPDFKYFEYVNPQAPKGGTLTEHGIGSFDSLNPFIITGTAAGGLQYLFPGPLYASLTLKSHEEPFSEYGYLAEKIDLAQDKKSITYTLRREATFHDGSPVRVEDVIFSFTITKEKGNPLYKAYYNDILRIEKTGERKVTFYFRDDKNKELPLIIGQMPIFSEAFYHTTPFEKPSLKIPLGNGPYKIIEVHPGHSITYEKVKNWWGDTLPINVGRYNFTYLKFIYFRDVEVAFQGFTSGTYDYRLEMSAKNWAKNYTFPAFERGDVTREQIEQSLYNGMSMLSFNTRRDQFKDWRVRKAIALLFDFEWTNKHVLYSMYKKRPLSFFTGKDLEAKGVPSEAERKILTPYKKDLPSEVLTHEFTLPSTQGGAPIRLLFKESLKLLREAGYQLKKNQLFNIQTDKPLRFEILFVDPSAEKLLQGFVKNLAEVGIKVTLKPVDTAQYALRINNFDFDMVIDASLQSDSPGNEQREMWGSKAADQKGSRNLTGIKSKVVDDLIEKLVDAQTREELVNHVKALDRVLMWGYYVVPLVHHDYIRFAYWKKLQRPSLIPAYGMDLMSWWETSSPTSSVTSSSGISSSESSDEKTSPPPFSSMSYRLFLPSLGGILLLFCLLWLGRRYVMRKRKDKEEKES